MTAAARTADETREHGSTFSFTAGLVTRCNLTWLGWTWLTVASIYAVIIIAVNALGSVDQTLWQEVVAGWQGYLVAGAGVTTMTSCFKLLVSNGVTRAQLLSSGLAAMGAVAVAGAGYITTGYAVEYFVYDALGWTQELSSGSVFALSDLPRVFVEMTVVLACFFAAGWLIGAGFYRFGVVIGLLLILPASFLVLLTELLVSKDFGGVDIDVLPEMWDAPNLLVTAVGGAVVLAVLGAAARWITLGTAVRND